MPASTTTKRTAPKAEGEAEAVVVLHVDHASLDAALAAFQAEVPIVRKGNEADVRSNKGNYKYAYADLSDVTAAALPLLGKHGLAFTSSPTVVDGAGFMLRYELRHETGGSIEGMYPLPDPERTPAQQLGSALTYARRYVLCAVTGVAPGGDDDDAHAVTAAAPDRPAAPRAQRAAQASAPAAPRDWLAEAKAAPSTSAVGALWRELRGEVQAGRGSQEVLDEVAVIGQERAAADAVEAPAVEAPADIEAAPAEASA